MARVVSNAANVLRSKTATYVWLAPLVVLAGCGGGQLPLGKVSGVVTLNGEPLRDGVIYFVPEKGPAAWGTLDDAGRYHLSTYGANDGAVAGKHTVYFAPPDDKSHLASYTKEDYAAGKPLPPPPPRKFLPTHYLSPETSELTAEVVRGANTHDFPLTGELK